MQGNQPFASISETVKTYVEGMARGDATALLRAFHPGVASIGHFDGGLEWMNIEEFVAACQSEAIPEGAAIPAWKIESIDIAGDTAIVRVVNCMAGLRFRDSLSLLMHEGRWQIVAKVFCQLPADASDQA